MPGITAKLRGNEALQVLFIKKATPFHTIQSTHLKRSIHLPTPADKIAFAGPIANTPVTYPYDPSLKAQWSSDNYLLFHMTDVTIFVIDAWKWAFWVLFCHFFVKSNDGIDCRKAKT